MKEISGKQMKILSVAFSLVICFAGIFSVVYAEGLEERTALYDNHVFYWSEEQAYEESLNVQEQTIGGMIIGMLLGIVVASNVMPIIANSTKTLESNADLDSNEQSMVGLWTTLVIIGVMVAIVGSVI